MKKKDNNNNIVGKRKGKKKGGQIGRYVWEANKNTDWGEKRGERSERERRGEGGIPKKKERESEKVKRGQPAVNP